MSAGAGSTDPDADPGADPGSPRRPFQRTVTVHKDSTGHVGVVVKKGKIVSLAKDSSAARNGLLTHHYICEVNGQNVIGMKVGAAQPRCREEHPMGWGHPMEPPISPAG